MSNRIARRTFLKQAAAGAALPLILSSRTWAQAPSKRLAHASIGVGGMGGSDLMSILSTDKVDVIAICDLDENNLNAAAAKVPNARKYRDWREMLEKEKDNIQSVNVTTPDHMHAPISMSAINLGKHVYCQKPLTHEVYEARQLRLAAKKAGVVTQMGIQIHANIAYRLGAQIIKDGTLGKIKEWHSWSSAPGWPQGIDRPAGEDPVPANVLWDLWLGVAPARPYKEGVYHPFNWRGWQDFGGGGLGDFGCHIFDPIFMGLNPGPVLKVTAECPEVNKETWPKWEIIRYEFAGASMTAGSTIQATWYDGGKKPPRELAQMPDDHKMPDSGSLIIGEEGNMILPHYSGPMLYPVEKFKGFKAPELEKNIDHYGQWVDACLGVGEATANFEFSGPLTESVLLGNVANRMKGLTLEWDSDNLRFKNAPEADALLRRTYREGWEIPGLS